ncbi:hypothetical protein ACLKA6_008964 [Drosophila palustris]
MLEAIFDIGPGVVSLELLKEIICEEVTRYALSRNIKRNLERVFCFSMWRSWREMEDTVGLAGELASPRLWVCSNLLANLLKK